MNIWKDQYNESIYVINFWWFRLPNDQIINLYKHSIKHIMSNIMLQE